MYLANILVINVHLNYSFYHLKAYFYDLISHVTYIEEPSLLIV